MSISDNFKLYHETLTSILSDVNSRLNNSESRNLVDKGNISSGSSVTLDFMESDTQRFTVIGNNNLPITINFIGNSSSFLTMFLQINNAGITSLVFPTIYWTLADGTYTTTISDYLTKIDRNSLSSTGPTWFSFWKVGTSIYGKIL